MLTIRPPVVAGTFYDIEPERLKKQISVAMKRAESDGTNKLKKGYNAVIVPHAAYQYSGWVAAKFYSLLDEDSPKRYIILGPNHSETGSNFAITNRGLWKTPLGGVVVNTDMADRLIERCALIKNDFMPHQNERSIEVQLPFLQYKLGEKFQFVPISVYGNGFDDTYADSCNLVGEAIADEVKNSGEKWMIIATTDFSHYVPRHVAEEVDGELIKAISKLNPKSLMRKITDSHASICGFGPVAIAMTAAKSMGSKSGRLLRYSTSADTTGEDESVVGYATILL